MQALAAFWKFMFVQTQARSALFTVVVSHHSTLGFNQLCLRSVLFGRASSLDFCSVCPVLVIRAEQIVEVPERRRVVVDECHVVEVMVVGTRPEWKDVLERPWEIYLLLGEFVSETCYPNYVTMDRDTYHNLSEHRWPGKDGE